MKRACEICSSEYDDAECSTICPHRLIMPREDLNRKIEALKLLGKTVRFNHRVEPVQIESISWNGFVTLAGFTGEFAPHLFTVIGEA